MSEALQLWDLRAAPVDPCTPQVRMREHGARALSDAELVALLLRPSMRHTALEMARCLLHAVDHDLQALGRLTLADLQRHGQMGEASAMAVLGALELGRRRRESPERDRPTVRTSADAYDLLRPRLADLSHEQFWLLLLDRGNRVIRTAMVSDGGMHGTVADPKRIFKVAMDHHTAGMILAHNHPSGQLRPSEEDIKLTKKMVEGAKLLDLAVQDHVICTEAGYYSFADNGMLW